MSTETGTTAEVRELAGKTAAEIRRRGWNRWSLVDWDRVAPDWMTDGELNEVGLANCGVCLLGGIAAAVTGTPFGTTRILHHPLVTDIARRVGAGPFGNDPLIAVSSWNDMQERTEADVLGLLDTIAAGR